MPRYFNTTGPCDPAQHYMLSATARLPSIAPFVERNQYFVVHAPRQTGKTTAMRALATELRARGYAACWATLEITQGMEDPALAEPLWIEALIERASDLPVQHRPPTAWPSTSPVGRNLSDFLRTWAAAIDAPIVLLLDEADVLAGASLVNFLRQLRAGFPDRGPGRFPTSIGLIGMRDLRDWLIQSKDGAPINPGSPFNIKAASITLRNFTAEEVGALLAQHTEETGQPFTPDAIAALATLTGGQPYLVNALADLCVTELVPNRQEPITPAHIDRARERLILARTTHLDSLAVRLKEPRVAAIVQAVLLGDLPVQVDTDDFQYVVDLGLLRPAPGGAAPANPLYREVLARQLSLNLQANLPLPWWPWATPDGRLDMPALLAAFRQWWRENADILPVLATGYPEAVPHLALCAFLQRVVNGGGTVHREFAAGRGAMDVLITYGPDRFAIELKRLRSRDRLDTVLQRGLAQLSGYLDTVGLTEGWLVIFDVRPKRSWKERLWTRTVDLPDGKRVVVLGA